MQPTITQEHWTAVRAALESTGERFADLLTSASPDARATTDWSVAETAAHVVAIAWMYTAIVRPDRPPLPIAAIDDIRDDVTIDTIAEFNDLTLHHFPERDPRVLAELITGHIASMLQSTEQADPAEAAGWLGGARVSYAGVLAHLINELHIHGRDIARAVRAPWVIQPQDAALFFELFLVGVTSSGGGRLLESSRPTRPDPIAVDFRSRHTTPVQLVLVGDQLSVHEPGGADAVVSFDPAVLNLMLFGRISRARALLTGKVVVRGRRPWLLPVFLRTVRMP